MTGTATRFGAMKAAVAALAVLYVIGALAALATATTGGGRSALQRIEAASSAQDTEPLAR